jgi:FKBP-type peptidyl-prolyl cis-trans isomerase
MIAGVDEGVALLKKGAKATLYLPSPIGYGEQAPPNIGPNMVLIFDVEITDVKAASAKPEMPMPTEAK